MVELAKYIAPECIKIEGFLFDSFYRVPDNLSDLEKKILDDLVHDKFPIFTLVIGGNRKLVKFLTERKAEKIL